MNMYMTILSSDVCFAHFDELICMILTKTRTVKLTGFEKKVVLFFIGSVHQECKIIYSAL